MSEFFKGLLGLILGAILWIVSSTVGGVIEGLGGECPACRFFLTLGFFIMLASPIWYWVIIPVDKQLKNRKRKKKQTVRIGRGVKKIFSHHS